MTPPRSRSRTYVAVAVTIVVVVIVLAYVLTGGFQRPSGSSTTVLVPADTVFSLPVDQFSGVSFIISTNATLNGTISESYGLQLYTMSPPQYQHLLTKGNLSGYEWTSGVLPNDTIYNIELTVPPGAWVLVFANPNNPQTLLSTSVGFFTDLTLTR